MGFGEEGREALSSKEGPSLFPKEHIPRHGKDDMEFARLDWERKERCGFPEFVYGAGKTMEQLLRIVPELYERERVVLVTRLEREKGEALARNFPEGRFDALSGAFLWRDPVKKTAGDVVVVCAGTSDLAVANEALLTLEACGRGAELLADVGVAGLHRLLKVLDRLRQAQILIVIAGMEGALPSVIGGLVKTPVIAVPTSVGYGVAEQGRTALHAMLSSCASGIVVVNIDNGFGAACAASRILSLTED